MHTLLLPAESRRVFVRSFWFTLAASALGGAAVLARTAGPPIATAALASVVLAAATAVVPFTAEQFARRVYHAWNGRIVRPVAAGAAGAVTRICFFVIVAAAGRPGAARVGAPPGRWTPRASMPADAYRTTSVIAAHDRVSPWWVSTFVRWAWRSGNLWSVSLLPFIAILRWVAGADDASPQANIYTLF